MSSTASASPNLEVTSPTRELARALSLRDAIALVLTVIGTAAAIALVRGRFRGRDLLNAFVTSPLLLPQILTGVALLQFYTLLKMQASYAALLIGHIVVTTPYVIRTVTATLTHFDLALEDGEHRFLVEVGSKRGEEVPEDPLTPRELDVVKLIAEGKTTKEVAVILGCSVKTAETHRSNFMRKLHLHSVSEVVLYAIRNQIIRVDQFAS